MFGITAYNSRRYDNRAALALGEDVGGTVRRELRFCVQLLAVPTDGMIRL